MPLEITDIKFYKSNMISDDNNNGGTCDYSSEVVSGVKYNLFPRVPYQERLNGVTRYRKEFMCNVNSSNEKAFGALFCILKPSNGGDRFYITAGTLDDTQGNLANKKWYGGGQLYEDINAGDTQIKIEFEADDYYIGEGALICIQDNTNIAWVTTKYNDFNEGIGTGDGTTTNYAYTLAYVPVREGSVSISYTVGGNIYTATDDENGNITGTEITSGSINYSTGDISLVFTTAPDNGSTIQVQYKKRCDVWINNVVIIDLQEQVPYSFSVADTYAGVCIPLGNLYTELQNITVTSTSGVFGETKVSLFNYGTEYDTFTIEFSDATNFTVTGSRLGVLPSGSINSVYSPNNPKTSTPYFSIDINAWSGTWTAGDTVVFTTIPAQKAIWWKEVVPAGTSREPNNIVTAEWFVE